MNAARDWVCVECGKRLSLKQAEKAFSNVQGCPKCGGADIQLQADIDRAIRDQNAVDDERFAAAFGGSQ